MLWTLLYFWWVCLVLSLSNWLAGEYIWFFPFPTGLLATECLSTVRGRGWLWGDSFLADNTWSLCAFPLPSRSCTLNQRCQSDARPEKYTHSHTQTCTFMQYCMMQGWNWIICPVCRYVCVYVLDSFLQSPISLIECCYLSSFNLWVHVDISLSSLHIMGGCHMHGWVYAGVSLYCGTWRLVALLYTSLATVFVSVVGSG